MGRTLKMRPVSLGAALVAAGWSAPASAGAWPSEPGEGQAIFTLTADWAERAFDDAGDIALDVDFRKHELSAFVEHGLTRRLTFVGRAALQDVDMGFDQGQAFAATELGARFTLARWDHGVLSLQGMGILPGEGENVINAPLGVGEGGAEARALAGLCWGDETSGGFVEGQAGYRWRSGEDPDEIRAEATIGVRFNERWMAMAQNFSTWSLEDLGPIDDYETHRAQASIVRRLGTDWSIQTGVLGSYAGRNVVEERAAFVAVWRRF